MKIEFFSTDYKNQSNIKLYENPFSDSQVVPSGRANGQTWRS